MLDKSLLHLSLKYAVLTQIVRPVPRAKTTISPKDDTGPHSSTVHLVWPPGLMRHDPVSWVLLKNVLWYNSGGQARFVHWVWAEKPSIFESGPDLLWHPIPGEVSGVRLENVLWCLGVASVTQPLITTGDKTLQCCVRKLWPSSLSVSESLELTCRNQNTHLVSCIG